MNNLRTDGSHEIFATIQSIILRASVSNPKHLRLNITLPVVLYGCKTWSLTLREEHKVRMFDNRVLKTSAAQSDGRGMWHVWRGEVCTRFWWGNLRERDHWRDHDVDGRKILRRILRKWEGVVRTRWAWLRIGTGGGRL